MTTIQSLYKKVESSNNTDIITEEFQVTFDNGDSSGNSDAEDKSDKSDKSG
jgi:hypothetical protein